MIKRTGVIGKLWKVWNIRYQISVFLQLLLQYSASTCTCMLAVVEVKANNNQNSLSSTKMRSEEHLIRILRTHELPAEDSIDRLLIPSNGSFYNRDTQQFAFYRSFEIQLRSMTIRNQRLNSSAVSGSTRASIHKR